MRHAWAVHFDHEDFYLDEAISGYVELVVQDVYMASKVSVNLIQLVTVSVSEKYVRKKGNEKRENLKRSAKAYKCM